MSTRSMLETRLIQIRDDLLRMGSLVDQAIDRAVQALNDRDVVLAQQVVDDDIHINSLRYTVEEGCLHVFATQQPMARDLRALIAAMNIGIELERMGDHAEGIAKIVLMLADEAPLKPYIDIPRMAQIAIEMMEGALEAYKQRDTALARRIIDRDDEVDELYDQLYRELLMFMIEERGTIQRATYLIWVAHNLERIADRVTNICERVVYLVEGKIHDLNVSKY